MLLVTNITIKKEIPHEKKSEKMLLITNIAIMKKILHEKKSINPNHIHYSASSNRWKNILLLLYMLQCTRTIYQAKYIQVWHYLFSLVKEPCVLQVHELGIR